MVSRYRIEAQIEMFNLLNSDAADTVRGVNFGTAAYQQAASASPRAYHPPRRTDEVVAVASIVHREVSSLCRSLF